MRWGLVKPVYCNRTTENITLWKSSKVLYVGFLGFSQSCWLFVYLYIFACLLIERYSTLISAFCWSHHTAKILKNKIESNLVTQIYNKIQKSNNFSTVQVKQKCEKESGPEISEDDWNDIWLKLRLTTRDHGENSAGRTSWLQIWNSETVWFSGMNVRQCGKSMTEQFHIIWGCPPMHSFWQPTDKIIRSVFGIAECSFVTLYLGKVADKLIALNKYRLSSKQEIHQL